LNGSETRSAPEWTGERSGERHINAAASVETILNSFPKGILSEDLRLEHELQTALGRQHTTLPRVLSFADGTTRRHACSLVCC
jgi:hypothetical protein